VGERLGVGRYRSMADVRHASTVVAKKSMSIYAGVAKKKETSHYPTFTPQNPLHGK